MAIIDQQFGVKKESVVGTPVTVDRFFRHDPGANLKPAMGKVETQSLRPNQWVSSSDAFTTFVDHVEGHVDLEMMTKSFGFWLEHMLGTVATTGPAETTVYTHTGTMGALFGKSFTAQLVLPFSPSGTAQAFTAAGCKIPKWSIKNSAEGNLMLGLDIWGMTITTATAVATYTETAGLEPFSFAGGVVSVGGSAYDVTDFEVEVDNGLGLDRQQIRGSTAPKEATDGGRSVSFTYTADFDALTQYNRVTSTTASGTGPQIIALWNGPTLLGSTLFPQVKVTIPFARNDTWEASQAAAAGNVQTVSGTAQWDRTNSPISVAIATADTTP